jgi:hypothetical protein
LYHPLHGHGPHVVHLAPWVVATREIHLLLERRSKTPPSWRQAPLRGAGGQYPSMSRWSGKLRSAQISLLSLPSYSASRNWCHRLILFDSIQNHHAVPSMVKFIFFHHSDDIMR